jgi:hypothetical protein
MHTVPVVVFDSTTSCADAPQWRFESCPNEICLCGKQIISWHPVQQHKQCESRDVVVLWHTCCLSASGDASRCNCSVCHFRRCRTQAYLTKVKRDVIQLWGNWRYERWGTWGVGAVWYLCVFRVYTILCCCRILEIGKIVEQFLESAWEPDYFFDLRRLRQMLRLAGSDCRSRLMVVRHPLCTFCTVKRIYATSKVFNTSSLLILPLPQSIMFELEREYYRPIVVEWMSWMMALMCFADLQNNELSMYTVYYKSLNELLPVNGLELLILLWKLMTTTITHVRKSDIYIHISRAYDSWQ